jgi:hypothetical protein
VGEDAVDDAYRVLQVDPSAEPEVIEAAYKRLARKYHPDLNADPRAAERMKELSAAYDVLRDRDRRAEYDRRRGGWRRWWRDRTERRSGARTPGKVGAEAAAECDVPCCWLHAARPAVDSCSVCGANLCRACALPFRPPGCAACVLLRARRVQRRAALGAGSFGVTFVTALVAVAPWEAQLAGALPIAYLVAATTLGIMVMTRGMWRSGWRDEPRDGGLGVAFLVWIGMLIGWLGAPVLLGKLALDLRRARQLELSARTALQAA